MHKIAVLLVLAVCTAAFASDDLTRQADSEAIQLLVARDEKSSHMPPWNGAKPLCVEVGGLYKVSSQTLQDMRNISNHVFIGPDCHKACPYKKKGVFSCIYLAITTVEFETGEIAKVSASVDTSGFAGYSDSFYLRKERDGWIVVARTRDVTCLPAGHNSRRCVQPNP